MYSKFELVNLLKKNIYLFLSLGVRKNWKFTCVMQPIEIGPSNNGVWRTGFCFQFLFSSSFFFFHFLWVVWIDLSFQFAELNDYNCEWIALKQIKIQSFLGGLHFCQAFTQNDGFLSRNRHWAESRQWHRFIFILFLVLFFSLCVQRKFTQFLIVYVFSKAAAGGYTQRSIAHPITHQPNCLLRITNASFALSPSLCVPQLIHLYFSFIQYIYIYLIAT